MDNNENNNEIKDAVIENYDKKINKVIDMFRKDDLYKEAYVDDENTDWRVFRRYSKKVLDTTWLEIIEDTLNNLDAIVRNPRRFIVVDEELIDTSRARSVTEDSVKFLAQHTNYIEGFDGDMILPSKLLNSIKEESLHVYENRFVYTLLRRLLSFVRTRYDALKGAANKNEQIELVLDKDMVLGDAKVTLRLDSIVKMPFEEALNLNNEGLGPIERLAKVYNIVCGFMATPFAKDLRNSEPVRPPITRTNAILKNTNFKKALALWEFLQSYDDEGYEIRSVLQSEEMPANLKKQYKLIVFLNNVFMQNLANESFHVKGTRTKPAVEEVTVEDFPRSDIGIEEVKVISVPSAYDNAINELNRAEINAAIDRVLAQQKIIETEQESALYAQRIAALRKKENAYKSNIGKLRKKQREILEKEAKFIEKERLKELAEQNRIEIERQKEDKQKLAERERAKTLNASINAEQKRLDEEAVNKVIKNTRTEQINANRAKISSEIINLNKMRVKLKAEFAKQVDEEIDGLIKQLPKLFNNNIQQ